ARLSSAAGVWRPTDLVYTAGRDQRPPGPAPAHATNLLLAELPGARRLLVRRCAHLAAAARARSLQCAPDDPAGEPGQRRGDRDDPLPDPHRRRAADLSDRCPQGWRAQPGDRARV